MHTTNITLHVVAGTLALMLGLLQLAQAKGGAAHRRRGRLFVGCMWTVIATAVVGLAAFRFRSGLALVTVLAAYWTYSGLRALRLRDRAPQMQDVVAAFSGLAAVAVFARTVPATSFDWAPPVIYTSLATLAMVCLYDLSRVPFAAGAHRARWMSEHIVKMIGAFGALCSAFAGTVLAAWQPFSQLAPTPVLVVVTVVLLRRYRATGVNARLATEPPR